jgi:hypothetical protein
MSHKPNGIARGQIIIVFAQVSMRGICIPFCSIGSIYYIEAIKETKIVIEAWRRNYNAAKQHPC